MVAPIAECLGGDRRECMRLPGQLVIQVMQ